MRMAKMVGLATIVSIFLLGCAAAGTGSSGSSQTFAITVIPSGAASGETVVADVTEAGDGDTVTLTVALNSGRQVELSASGVSLSVSVISSDGDSATFTMPARAVDVAATFSYLSYAVGDTGPAGGIVFYDDEADSTDDIAGARYLEAWTSDEAGTHQWKTTTTATAGTSTDKGTGFANTYTWMTGVEHPAAEVIRNATHGGFDDWFLPSRGELNVMYAQRVAIGGFAAAVYWASSGSSFDDSAWGNNFDAGGGGPTTKTDTNRVRAIRSF